MNTNRGGSRSGQAVYGRRQVVVPKRGVSRPTISDIKTNGLSSAKSTTLAESQHKKPSEKPQNLSSKNGQNTATFDIATRNIVQKSAVSAQRKSPNQANVVDRAKQKSLPKNRVQAKRQTHTKKLARTARLLEIMEQENQTKPAKSQRRRRRLSRSKLFKGGWRAWVPQLAAGVLVLVALYSIVDTWLLNRQIKEDLGQTVSAAQSDDPESRQAAEGKDEAEVSSNTIDSYKVAADLPRVITISKIGVRARVLQMGVNSDGSMQAPINIFDAGWYTGSVKPGQLGAAAIVAHASGPTHQGLFGRLDSLGAGDAIQVERGDGSVLNYEVVKTETVALDQVDMNAFLRPTDGVNEGLNLMTCAGEWVQSSETRDRRVIVYTKRVS